MPHKPRRTQLFKPSTIRTNVLWRLNKYQDSHLILSEPIFQQIDSRGEFTIFSMSRNDLLRFLSKPAK